MRTTRTFYTYRYTFEWDYDQRKPSFAPHQVSLITTSVANAEDALETLLNTNYPASTFTDPAYRPSPVHYSLESIEEVQQG